MQRVAIDDVLADVLKPEEIHTLGAGVKALPAVQRVIVALDQVVNRNSALERSDGAPDPVDEGRNVADFGEAEKQMHVLELGALVGREMIDRLREQFPAPKKAAALRSEAAKETPVDDKPHQPSPEEVRQAEIDKLNKERPHGVDPHNDTGGVDPPQFPEGPFPAVRAGNGEFVENPPEAKELPASTQPRDAKTPAPALAPPVPAPAPPVRNSLAPVADVPKPKGK